MKKLICVNLLAVSLVGCGGAAGISDEEPVAEQRSPLSTPDAPANVNDALRAPRGRAYSFTNVAAFGERTPSGEQFNSYFFPHSINDQGDLFFESATDSGSSLFRVRSGQPMEQFAAPGKAAPGGGVYGDSIAGFGTGMNKSGTAVFKYLVDADYKDSAPSGRHQGIFRIEPDGSQRALVRPGVTLAPNGRPFIGSHMYSGINRDKDVVFGGMIHTTKGIKAPPEADLPYGSGVFLADASGGISSIVSPGDPAPGRGVFDFAMNPTINDRGDVAFGGHIAGERCTTFGLKQADRIFCAESVYLYRKSSGRILSVAHQDESAPGGGKYNLAFGGVVNSQGDVVFIGDFTPPPGVIEKAGVFLWSRGSVIAVARPGDSMPGGGRMVSASGYVQGYSLNDRGEVFFFARLSTDRDGDGKDDNGVFVWKDGTIRTVLRSGTNLPGMGTVSLISSGLGFGAAVSNNNGEVLTYVTTTAGNGYLVKATPR